MPPVLLFLPLVGVALGVSPAFQTEGPMTVVIVSPYASDRVMVVALLVTLALFEVTLLVALLVLVGL